MSKINFSKAPDGATHYRSGVADTTLWYKKDPSTNPFGYHWMLWCEAIEGWGSCGGGAIEATKMHKQQTVTCNNEREVMLCKQVLRMCRGEAGQYKDPDGNWKDINKAADHLGIDYAYRAKPKKELVVPWEWIADDIYRLDINECGVVTAISHTFKNSTLPIKLDIKGVDLPVTIDRPSEK